MSQHVLNTEGEGASSASALAGHSLYSVKYTFVGIAILAALVTYFWWPALFHGQVIVHADSAHHGFSLLLMLHEWVHGNLDSLLWSTGIYGGHPLFAESQGGFLNPLNLISVALFDPVTAFGFLHWANMLAFGLGVYALCRILDIDCWSATFAAITLVFCMTWVIPQSNLTVSSAMVWVSWSMAAVQYWLKSPNLLRATIIAFSAACLVYSGYPHFALALAVYFACFLIAWVVTREGRDYVANNYRQLIASGAFAIVVTVGLSAVQLIPLFELAQASHRSDGVSLVWEWPHTWQTYVSGFFFFSWYDLADAPNGIYGIFSAALFALLVLLIKLPQRILAHLFATFLLLNLGVASTSPIFNLIYEYGLIPGLRGFRIMTPFLGIACVGLAVLGAYFISSLAKGETLIISRWLPASKYSHLLVLLAIFSTLLFIGYYFFLPGMRIASYLFGAASLLSILALTLFNRLHLIPPVLVILLAAEMVILRSDVFNFYDASVLEEPRSVTKIKDDADYGDYNTYSSNGRKGFAFLKPNSPKLERAYRRYLNSLTPFPTLNFGVPSIEGVLALNLHRHAILSDQLRLESTGLSTLSAGSRLIDILGVRYFSFNVAADVAGFEEIAKFAGMQLHIYRNSFARPKLQTYTQAVSVANPEEALSHLQNSPDGALVIEAKEALAVDTAECNSAAESVALQDIVTSSQYYAVTVESECPGWLFLRDAYYPGWQALRNGERVELFPAQVLGKAVYFPEGKSRMEIRYRPMSFYVGAAISVLTLLILCGLFIRHRIRAANAAPEGQK